ncbi:putative platelet glycoprotein Ib alpha chain [Apostichopus japonicus]|uniref:Putative platelet glycoprotein Ib alpha chain n=1 Tax=Stichopus japonicus TaxID=307972 RepID=A0A2G8L8J2_STIJA|nr:putative platelet glycoprotein Ib alpha chain [Apostichopus japonicus]
MPFQKGSPCRETSKGKLHISQDHFVIMFLAGQKLLSLSIVFITVIVFRVATCSEQCQSNFGTLHCNGQTRNINTFPEEPTLQGYATLLVTFTNISSLQNGLVILPPLPQLETLVLSSNGILVLNDSLVENNQQIKSFHLQYNALSSVPIKVLENLPNLTYLDLSYNNILTIPENAFHTNHKLGILFVRGNDLNQVHPDALNGVFSLKYIDLSSNILDRFSFELFQRVPELTKLIGIYLDDSRITNYPIYPSK